MKVEDYIKIRNAQPKRKARSLGSVAAMMITHERPGMLRKTVDSFLSKTPSYIRLTVIDDGSESVEKKRELSRIEERGIRVLRFPKGGFITTWLSGLEWARKSLQGIGGMILLEDDLSFATGWSDVLVRMYEGAADLGYMPGAMSCLRVHEVPQSRVLDLLGVPSYQSMGHSFQVNLMPWEVIENREMIDRAEKDARRGKHGIDVYLLGAISDRMGRTNFMSVESWVAHEGAGSSLVESQGYRSLRHRGHGLVVELRDGPLV